MLSSGRQEQGLMLARNGCSDYGNLCNPGLIQMIEKIRAAGS
jgi:hypothetical protein